MIKKTKKRRTKSQQEIEKEVESQLNNEVKKVNDEMMRTYKEENENLKKIK